MHWPTASTVPQKEEAGGPVVQLAEMSEAAEEGAPPVLRALKMVVEPVELEEHEGFQRHSWQPARLPTLRLLEVHWEVMVALREVVV